MGRGIVESGLFRSERYQLEQRTSDPATTQEGDMWIRTDLAPDTDQIGTLRFDAGGGVVYDIPIYATGASSASVEEAARMQVSATAGFIPVVDFADLTPTFDELRMQHNTTQYGLHDVATIPAVFDVTITNTNSPVAPGTTLSVDYSVDNTGDLQDTEDIRLEIDSVEEDRDSNITLKGGASTTGTLSWDTTNATAADYSATVLSNDDSDSVTVTVESAAPASGIARYEFEQDVRDSWNSNDLSLSGGTFTTDSAVGSYALSLDGADDEASGTASASGNISFTGWIRNPSGASDRDYWFGTPDVYSGVGSDGTLFSRTQNGSNNIGSTNGAIRGEGWKFVAVTVDSGNSITQYVDGSQDDTFSHSQTINFSGTIRVGNRSGIQSSRYWEGEVDDIRLYDKYLSSTEVSNLYNTGSIS